MIFFPVFALGADIPSYNSWKGVLSQCVAAVVNFRFSKEAWRMERLCVTTINGVKSFKGRKIFCMIIQDYTDNRARSSFKHYCSCREQWTKKSVGHWLRYHETRRSTNTLKAPQELEPIRRDQFIFDCSPRLMVSFRWVGVRSLSYWITTQYYFYRTDHMVKIPLTDRNTSVLTLRDGIFIKKMAV